MKSLMLLWSEVLTEVGTWCGVSTELDRKTAEFRFEHEGLSFLTITLPTYAKSLQKALERGWVIPSDFSCFKKRQGRPEFLQGFLDLVFDRSSGFLLNEPNVDAIFAIRQICLFAEKINVDCSDERKTRAYAKFIECEQQVKESDLHRSDDSISAFRRLCGLLFADVLCATDRSIAQGDIVPKHGPGTTAERTLGNQKFYQRSWTRRLESVFPCREYLIASERFADDLDRVDLLEPGDELPVRVVQVPKTLKSPRIIAIEPVAMQYVQQGVAETLWTFLHASRVPGWERRNLASLFINLNDQQPNQLMAQQGSIDGSLATLDLSDASDRVSNQLVREMLRNHRLTFEAVDACRSRKADVPGYGVIRLAKFASMGSALTFPVETMVFLAIIFVGIEKGQGKRLTRKDIASFAGRVRVYGDDIVVPASYAVSVISALEDFGLSVNRDKTFMNGSFRESCGGDFYNGVWVTPVRVRSLLPTSWTDAEEMISTVELRNNLYKAGLWKTASYVDGIVEGLIDFYPSVHPDSPVLGRHTFLNYQVDRMCPELHRPLVKGVLVRATPPINEIDGQAALLKYFLKRGQKPLEREHLERSGRPKRVALKLGWAPPY